ncbi:MAG: Fe-S cluster assembly protein SufD, partial [Solirubrobacterales bacterium]
MARAQAPDWTAGLRKRGQEAFDSLPTPVQKDKGWEFTDVSALDLDAWQQPTDGNLDASPARKPVVDSNGGPGVLQVDGASMAEGHSPNGIVVSMLEEAVAEYPELVERHLGTLLTDRDRFTAQNTAEWRGGSFVHVPAGVRVEQPIVTSVLHDSPSALHWRSLIVVEEGAEVTLAEQWASTADDLEGYFNPVTELI